VQPVERPVISAFALRVRDASYAFKRALDLGAWASESYRIPGKPAEDDASGGASGSQE
jgi:4-hydroxyphenylpyruvate dioxygenase-like putative hemolysin